jgi:hypothetical protein
MAGKAQARPMPLRLNKYGWLRANPDAATANEEIRARLKARSSASRAKVTLPKVPWKKDSDDE